MLFVFLEGIWLIIAASTDPIRLPLTHVPFLRVRLEGAMYNYEISGTIYFFHSSSLRAELGAWRAVLCPHISVRDLILHRSECQYTPEEYRLEMFVVKADKEWQCG